MTVDPRLTVIAATLHDIVATPNLPEENIFEHARRVITNLEQSGFVVVPRDLLERAGQLRPDS